MSEEKEKVWDQRDAEHWAKEGLATAKYDICNHCGKRYWLENPECNNAKLHGAR